MSLFDTMNAGASGMGASSTNLSVIGDNIANIGTVGYKATNATFADAFPNIAYGLGGAGQLGTGSRLSDLAIDFGQGSVNASASAIDVAIMGQGFFQVANGDEKYYTRDGSFHLDPSGNLLNSAGMNLQGFQAVDGTLTSTVGDLRIDTGGVPQQGTSAITLNATLSAEADFTDAPFGTLRAATPLDGSATAPTMDTLSQNADYSTSVTIYDSLGVAHDVTMFFERDSAVPEQWNVYAVVDGGQIDTNGDGLPDGTAGAAFEIGTGTVTFDTQGNLVASSGLAMTAGWTFPGSDPFTPEFDFGLDPAGLETEGSLRMTGNESFVTTVGQDGYAAGNLDSLRVDADGTIVGQYTNGQERDLGRLAIATFESNSGLDRVGGNLYRATAGSGDPALGAAGEGGRGSTTGYALEGSNVELEDQFVHMIQAQRMYQANTSVISTADEALQTLIQLV